MCSIWTKVNKLTGFFKNGYAEIFKKNSLRTTKLQIDRRALIYVRLFRHDDFHKFAEDNGILVDDSETYDGQLKVLTSSGEKVPVHMIKEIRLYIDSITQNLAKDYIDIGNVQQNFEMCKDYIRDTGKQYETMIDYADHTKSKLVLMGLSDNVQITKFEVSKILGLQTPGKSYLHESPNKTRNWETKQNSNPRSNRRLADQHHWEGTSVDSPYANNGMRSPNPNNGMRSPNPNNGMRSPNPNNGMRSPNPNHGMNRHSSMEVDDPYAGSNENFGNQSTSSSTRPISTDATMVASARMSNDAAMASPGVGPQPRRRRQLVEPTSTSQGMNREITADEYSRMPLDASRASSGTRPRSPRKRQLYKAPPVPSGEYSHVSTGVTVITIVADITTMNVDAVVNAANSELKHYGGVAFAIAGAAGPSLDRECSAYLSKHGELPVTETCITTAGDMPAQCVIHTVGPQWSQFKAPECVKQLYETFSNVLDTADKQHFKSIAVPAISSGIFGMPSHLVTETAVNSITDYLSMATNTWLSHIYLVGVDKGIIRGMEAGLERHVKRGAYTTKNQAQQAKESNQPTKPSSNEAGLSEAVEATQPSPNETVITDTNQTSQPSSTGATVTAAGGDVEQTKLDDCCICMSQPDKPKTLPICNHTFCTDCIDASFRYKPACPTCGTIYGEITGDQPINGHMMVDRDNRQSLPGYEGYGVIVINYTFPNGTQSDDMPSPGQFYSGTHRTAFLPDSPEGNKVLQLLGRAFQARLIFTVGRSRTTGADNTVTWNDIHHKTNMNGGPQMFGYPDPTYLNRVQEELAAKGIK